MLEIGKKVKDLIGDFDSGEIIDRYINNYNYTEGGPTTMFIVDFGDDQIFDRLPHEIIEIKD